MAEKFYYDTKTGEVTQGKETNWDDRMGPYDTREEAENAMKIANERTKAADRKDEADDDWGEPASWEKN
ncbi:hypothetical protein [Corynebacterium sp.]|uniref:hypothetical protein n=1 Tax=Corynebacterium sp. TaxID=1720 RepID=UPI003734F593